MAGRHRARVYAHTQFWFSFFLYFYFCLCYLKNWRNWPAMSSLSLSFSSPSSLPLLLPLSGVVIDNAHMRLGLHFVCHVDTSRWRFNRFVHVQQSSFKLNYDESSRILCEITLRFTSTINVHTCIAHIKTTMYTIWPLIVGCLSIGSHVRPSIRPSVLQHCENKQKNRIVCTERDRKRTKKCNKKLLGAFYRVGRCTTVQVTVIAIYSEWTTDVVQEWYACMKRDFPIKFQQNIEHRISQK